MERLEFEDYEEFACEIANAFDSLDNEFLDDEFCEASIIAKYNEAKEIIKELLYIGYDIASIDLHKEEFENYNDEYIISISNLEDGQFIWCEKFKRENGYLSDKSTVTYVMDNCSSTVFKHIESEEIYEVCVGEDTEECSDKVDNNEYEPEHSYMVNGKFVNKNVFNEYVSKFAPELVDRNTDDEDKENTDSGYSVTLDTDEAEKMIRDMRENFQREFFDMFGLVYKPYPYLFGYHPIIFG